MYNENGMNENFAGRNILNNNFRENSAVIKVVGVGGGGCNAINSMIESGIKKAKFIAVNTDSQALMMSKADCCLQIGVKLTKGLGAGSNPEIGEAAAEENKKEIEEMLRGTDLLFIASGMGGGTGTGAAPVIARIARELKILTVAVVTKPFSFEGRIRSQNAKNGIANLRKYVDTLVTIPNDKLLQFMDSHIAMVDAFKVADDMLKQGIVGIVDLIATPSLINLDFADVSTVMRDKGLAHMGLGRAKGDKRVVEAVRQAVASPLLETTIEGAKAIILNVTGGKDLLLEEVTEAAELIQGIIDSDANIIFGATIDNAMSEELKITIIATGFVDPESPVIATNVGINESEKEDLPLLREIEKTEEVQNESAAEEFETENKEIEEELKKEPEEKQGGKELPAFMRKIFGKKN